MGKTLRRYFLVEMGGTFLAGVGVFTCVVFVQRVIELVEMVLARGVPGELVARLFLYIIPSFLEFTVPMALLLSIVVSLSRMASDGEIIALRAAGLNILQMLRPVLTFAAIVGVLTLLLAAYVRPWGNREMKQTIYEIAKTRATAALRPRYFNNDFSGMVIYVDEIDPEAGRMTGVMVADERDSFRRTTIFAQSGNIVANEDSKSVYLQLSEGTSISFHAAQESYDWTNFASLEVNLDSAGDIGAPTREEAEPEDLFLPELLEFRAARIAAGESGLDETIELHRKLSLAASSLILAILAIPLGMQPTRAVRARGLGVSLLVVLAYYVMVSGGVTLARRESLDPVVAMWLPNLAMAIVAVWMFARAARDKLLYPSVFSGLRLRFARSGGAGS